MSKTYQTSEIARIIGVHPNTVRLYESMGLISKVPRAKNGYRVFNEIHLQQFKIARLAFQVEVVQNNLRKQAALIAKTCAKCEFEKAIRCTETYISMIEHEKKNAEKAIKIVQGIIQGTSKSKKVELTRKQAAESLGVTIDTLRNWELNGLIKVKRKKNNYRIYNQDDIDRLTIIKALRCANYSLSAILRLLNNLDNASKVDVEYVIDKADDKFDIVSTCDTLLTSLARARENSEKIIEILKGIIKEKK